jgi:hypothetical protein
MIIVRKPHSWLNVGIYKENGCHPTLSLRLSFFRVAGRRLPMLAVVVDGRKELWKQFKQRVNER